MDELFGVNANAGRIDFPRTWEAGRLYWMAARHPNTGAVGLGLAGTGVSVKAETPPAPEDVRVLAGTTDVDASFFSMRDSSDKLSLSAADVPIKQFFGKRQTAEPWRWWRPPMLLREGYYFLISALGQNAETGGNLVLLCDPLGATRRTITLPETAVPSLLTVSAGLAGTVNETKTVRSTVSHDKHTLIWGAGSDLSAVSVQITDGENEQWSSDPVPGWSVWGYPATSADARVMGQINKMIWPRPYYLAPGRSMRFLFQNPAAGMEAGGNVYLYATRWAV